jgi:HSP20 family protein
MSNLTVFDPMREMASLRNMVDNLFEGMLSTQDERWLNQEGMALDMYQTADEIVVKAALPGVKAQDLNVSVADQVLTIRGQVNEENAKENSTYHIRERRIGNYVRSVQLPAPVVADKAKAELQDGILVLTLPKAENVRPKTISVKVK